MLIITIITITITIVVAIVVDIIIITIAMPHLSVDALQDAVCFLCTDVNYQKV